MCSVTKGLFLLAWTFNSLISHRSGGTVADRGGKEGATEDGGGIGGVV